MATLIPPSSNVEAAYEDMFKEITRKLYGEETGNGLHTLGTPVAQVATTGPTAPEGERSFTNLIDRSSAPTIEYEHNAGGGAVPGATATAAAAASAQNANVVIQQQPEGSVVVATTGGGGNFKTEDHLSTAFGLAALMQNGFATTTGTILSTQAINKVVTNAAGQQQQQQQNTNIAVVTDQQQQQRWSADGTAIAGSDQQQQPQIVQWTTTTGGKLQSYTTAQQQQQVTTAPKSKSKNRNDHSTPVSSTTAVIYTSPSTSGNSVVNSGPNQTQQIAPTTTNATNGSGSANSTGGGSNRKKSHNNQQNGGNNNGGIQIQKRYPCTHCPYSTDRRDLYTRHENIHKDEKPFQCYACLKQFNRADHVKKHFLRMHREMQYDINKTRRHVPSSSNAGNHHSGGRGNVTITAVSTSSNNHSNSSSAGGSPDQKPNIFQANNVHLDNAFLEGQRQPTSSSLSIAETIEAVASAADAPLPQLKQEKSDDGNSMAGGNGSGSLKPKREKRFTCCYCPWSGADKWGLKRHLNTHTKPFVCLLCDYKAARSERLATHVLKVHNKRACSKCSFLADTQEEFQSHINEVHPHDNRPARNSNNSNDQTDNLNVLRTIGNSLVANNQLNTFQNAGNTFGIGSSSNTTSNTIGNAGGSVTIYTTTTTNDNGNLSGGPLQEIIVNPTSMVGWRLSANGSLIPPHDLLTGGLPNAATQKRGSERLFQYLEADGSDPEDYARLLKMDAISRNTASVAQDFHKAGGVHELKIPANHQLLFNNKLPSQWTTREAAALLHSLSNTSFAFNQQQQKQRSKLHYQQQCKDNKRKRQHSTGEEDEDTPSSASSTTSNDDGDSLAKSERSIVDRKPSVAATAIEQRKAMSAFLEKNFDLQETTITTASSTASELASSNLKRKQNQRDDQIDLEDQENQEQLIKSPPAYTTTNKYTLNYKNNYNNQMRNKTNQCINANNNNNTICNGIGNTNANANPNTNGYREHRLDLFEEGKDNKENAHNAAATFLTTMEYQNLNKIGTQFQNYVKDIISKYYADAPLMFPAMPTPTATAQQSQQQQQHSHQQQQQQHHSQPPPQSPPKRRRLLSETEEYIEYLKNKEDITLTITPKVATNQKVQLPLKRQQDLSLLRKSSPKKTTPQHQHHQQPVEHNNPINGGKSRKSLSHLATLLPLLADAASKQEYLAAPIDFSQKHAPQTTQQPKQQQPKQLQQTQQQQQPQQQQTRINGMCNNITVVVAASTSATTTATDASNYQNGHDKRSSRKQAQPKKIRTPPEVVVATLRDKYLNRMVDRKHSCCICSHSQRSSMLVFNYHTKGSLALHGYWKHGVHAQRAATCTRCCQTFKYRYSLSVHNRLVHHNNKKSEHFKNLDKKPVHRTHRQRHCKATREEVN